MSPWINTCSTATLTLLASSFVLSCTTVPDGCYPEPTDVSVETLLSNSLDTASNRRVSARFDSGVTQWHFTTDSSLTLTWLPPARSLRPIPVASATASFSVGQSTPGSAQGTATTENVVPGQERAAQTPTVSSETPRTISTVPTPAAPFESSAHKAKALAGELTLDCAVEAADGCREVRLDVELPAHLDVWLTTRVHNQRPGCTPQMAYTLTVLDEAPR